jgi:hypothetical protein
MSHIGSGSSNITVVQRITPDLRASVCAQANASWAGRIEGAKCIRHEEPGGVFQQFIPIQNSVVLLRLTNLSIN